MNNVIVAFPKEETAGKIKRILSQSGYHVTRVCLTGAQTLSCFDGMEAGILVCGYRFVDMVYEEIFLNLPEGFQMLLIANPANVAERGVENLVCLSTPLKVHELLSTMEMMDYNLTRFRKKKRLLPRSRSDEEKQLIRRAKGLLMERNGLTEEEAHRYLQKRSMENGTGLTETAQMIVSLMK